MSDDSLQSKVPDKSVCDDVENDGTTNTEVLNDNKRIGMIQSIENPQQTTQDDNVSDSVKNDKPNTTNLKDTVNTDTVIKIDDTVEEQSDVTADKFHVNINDTVLQIDMEHTFRVNKASEAEQLKLAVFKDQGLQGVYVIAGKGKRHRSKRDQYGGDKYSERLVWVQSVIPQPSGVEMDEGSRGPFIRKVFGILFICMLITSAFATMSFVIPGIRLFFQTPAGLLVGITALLFAIGLSYAMVCSECTRAPPCNFICLLLVVLCYSVIFMFVTAKYKLALIFMALFVTTLVVLLCFILAFTPIDFTKYMIYVVMFLGVLCMFSFVVFIVQIVFKIRLAPLRLAIAFAMTLTQSVLFIIEIQMVLGGKTVELREDEYVMGAYMLYTSIMELFFQILRVLALLEELDLI